MIPLIGDHLWQSTLFALAVAAVALALRKNRAQVRHWLWLAASVKFLVPFAALAAIGSQFEWHAPLPTAAPAIAVTLDTVSQPFSTVELGAVDRVVSPGPDGAPFRLVLLTIWGVGTTVILAVWCIRWRRVSA